jgi:hypothetical protein
LNNLINTDMKKMYFLLMLFVWLASNMAYAGNPIKGERNSVKKEVRSTDDPPGMVKVMGHLVVISSDNGTTCVQCNEPNDVICLWKSASYSSPLPSCGAPAWTDQYNNVLDPNKTYVGVPIDGGVHFYEVNTVDVTCATDGTNSVIVNITPAITF